MSKKLVLFFFFFFISHLFFSVEFGEPLNKTGDKTTANAVVLAENRIMRGRDSQLRHIGE